jgi:hypothetical protein
VAKRPAEITYPSSILIRSSHQKSEHSFDDQIIKAQFLIQKRILGFLYPTCRLRMIKDLGRIELSGDQDEKLYIKKEMIKF